MGVCISCCKRGGEDDADDSNCGVSNPMACRAGKAGRDIKISNQNNLIGLSGSGTFLGSMALECDSAYFEVVLKEQPQGLRIGLKRYSDKQPVSLDGVLNDDEDAWYCKHDNLQVDDIIGILWDQTDFPMLSFTRNGEPLHKHSIARVRPANNVYPAISLDVGSRCSVAFMDEDFKCPPPNRQKFRAIVGATSLI